MNETRHRSIGTLVALVFLLGLGEAGTAWAKGQPGGIVVFEDLRSPTQKEEDPKDENMGGAMLELYRRHYNKPNAKPEDVDWDSFLTYQATISEMLMKPDLHTEAEKNFMKLIRDGEEDPDLYYISSWASSTTTMFNGSGDIKASRRGMADPEMGVLGKSLYFPSEDALEKIRLLTIRTHEITGRLTKPYDEQALEDFFRQKEELEKELLQIIAQELSEMRDAIGSNEIYGMGHIEKPDGTMEPIKLDLAFLEQFMAERNVSIPGSTRAGATGGPAGRDLNQQFVTVRQNPKVLEENASAYRLFVNGFPTETERTRAEVEYDLFRLRISPSDLNGGEFQKTYDPLMTPEYQVGGGLSLPAAMPKDE